MAREAVQPWQIQAKMAVARGALGLMPLAIRLTRNADKLDERSLFTMCLAMERIKQLAYRANAAIDNPTAEPDGRCIFR